jgi:hypothetical protein
VYATADDPGYQTKADWLLREPNTAPSEKTLVKSSGISNTRASEKADKLTSVAR